MRTQFAGVGKGKVLQRAADLLMGSGDTKKAWPGSSKLTECRTPPPPTPGHGEGQQGSIQEHTVEGLLLIGAIKR